MRLSKFIMLLSSLLLLETAAYAHALWIETTATGKAGQAHQVKVFYGEFELNNLEPIEKWYADVKTFKLWLTHPNGQQEQITVTPAQDHFTATFTPKTAGQYQLHVNHLTGEVAGTTVYEFNSSATVAVGSEKVNKPVITASKTLTLQLPDTKTPQVKKPLTVNSFYPDGAAKELEITVMSPAGWQRKVNSGTQGQATFTPEWSGKYLLEAQHKENTTGERNGKPYQSIYKISTLQVVVK
ncbi:hypothetical protein HUW51_05600 [Adhaeribacter swui]|uniref:DUF4198 domain-containing protein n=1 Tax=Adhaeribacter swui TaxID=2086471 RepID=A0A7G7G4Z5_9BACT|nr:hypothetical protein [Adhaeribacter swui]QNF32229.1 hypothetical protein HUW51_05600 [Adhaeribacter swui]